MQISEDSLWESSNLRYNLLVAANTAYNAKFTQMRE